MKRFIESIIKFALLLIIWFIWWLVYKRSLSNLINLSVIAGGVLLTFPLVCFGRKILDRKPTIKHAEWTTTFVHFGLGFTFGIPIVRAVSTNHDWFGWKILVPTEIGWVLVIITGAICFLIVLNLAIKGLGAPFFIALSRKLTSDWLYGWSRNPMALSGLAFFLSLGIWFQSALFLLWVLIVLSPAFVFFAKVYEERELEIRFGESYLEYKSRTPMFFPRKPGKVNN
jgi:protein-S-isoprenylcysteine O-methyltransferase Ste14